MSDAAKIILEKCLGLKQDESVLIVTDSELRKIGDKILEAALQKTSYAELVEIQIPEASGMEPPEDVAKQLLDYKVVILVTTKSLSHTNAREQATKNGARIATLPNINEEIMERCIDIDYDALKERTSKIAKVLDEGKEVQVTSPSGTDITFSIEDRKADGDHNGLYLNPGDWGNLPQGEAFIAPVEGSAEGLFAPDASFAGIGRLSEPLKIGVLGGNAVDFDGPGSERIKGLVQKAGEGAANIAEFGIGTNDKAVVSGNVLEDEKVLGTCHIAIGSNFAFGGKVNVPLHMDGIITKPTIIIDGKKIMDDGRLLL